MGGAAILYADAFAALDIHGSGRKEGWRRERWHQHYCLPALSSNPPPVLVAATVFESCKLTMRAVRGAGLHTPEKSRTSVVDAPHWHRLLLDDRRDLHLHRSRTPLVCRGGRGLNLERGAEPLGSQKGEPSLEVDCRHRGLGLLARDSIGGMGNIDVDIAGAADSLTGDVMVTVIVVVVVMSAWASNIVWGIKKRESGRGRTGRYREVWGSYRTVSRSPSPVSPHTAMASTQRPFYGHQHRRDSRRLEMELFSDVVLKYVALGPSYSGSKNRPNVWLFRKDELITNPENSVKI